MDCRLDLGTIFLLLPLEEDSSVWFPSSYGCEELIS